MAVRNVPEIGRSSVPQRRESELAIPRNRELFYPASCHGSGVSRRQFLAGSAALVGLGASEPRAGVAGDDGAAIIRRNGAAAGDPWAVCHGVRAMGPEFRLDDGRRAVDFLLETQLASVAANGKTVLAFPVEVEVHPNSFLKTMLEAGVPLDYGFRMRGTKHTLRDVVDGARALFRPARVGESPNMLPWSIIAFAVTTTTAQRQWTNAWGEPVDLDTVVGGSLRLLEQASLPLMEAMRAGKPMAARAPVHAFTCGGTHMLYALLVAMKAGYDAQDRLDRTRRQVDLLLVRLTTDVDLIERFYGQRTTQAGRYWFELDAKLKLLGHAEECLAFGTRRGLVRLDPAQQAQRQQAVAALRRMIHEMEEKDMRGAREVNPELFRQLVGDTCHARHGLVLA